MPEDLLFDVILFDLEGTLVDFQWRLDEAVGEILPVLEAFGIDLSRYPVSPSYAELFNTTRDLTQAWPPLLAARLFDQLGIIYEKYDKDALSRWKPYPETQPLLSRLAGSGYRMGVVSNCGAFAAGNVLRRFGLSQYFEIILSRNDVSYIKPSPESLALALEKLCISPDRALFIGDSINDILAAHRIAMPSCFLLGGESAVTGEDAEMATFKISSLSDLAHILIQ